MIIDVHTHLFESAGVFPGMWLQGIYNFKRTFMSNEEVEAFKVAFQQSGRVEALIVDMDEAGIDKSVALALDFAIMCRQEPEISIWKANEYIAEAQSRYPDRIIGFAGVDPLRGQEAVRLLEKAVGEWGLKGVKVIQSFYKVTDPEVQAFFAKLNELNVPALIHTGSDPWPFAIENGNPAGLDTLAQWYPDLTMIAAHCSRGYGELLGEILTFREGQVFADIAGLQYEAMKSPWHFQLQMRYLMDKVPRSILMGTDWPFIKTPPMLTHREWFDAIRNLSLPNALVESGVKDFSAQEKALILGGNAQRLLGL